MDMDMVEGLRRTMRSALGSSSRVYQTLSRIANITAIIRKEGSSTLGQLQRLSNAQHTSENAVAVSFSNLQFPLLLRPGTADVKTVVDTVVREIYGHFKPLTEPLWMIDAGAYIGDTAAYFLSRFPRLKIIALEPNPPSHGLAERNLAPYGERCVLLNRGLWATDGVLCLGGKDPGHEDCVETHASTDTQGIGIASVSVPTLLKEFAIPRIDLFKIDIEGAEKNLFSRNAEQWINQVDLLIIEIDDPDIYDVVRKLLTDNGFCVQVYRGIWCARRKPQAK